MKEKINLIPELLSIGVPEYQAVKLEEHIKKAEHFVYMKDAGLSGAYEWIHASLDEALPKRLAELLFRIALDNKANGEVAYLEQGYDSCQSQRKVAKIVGEAILLGGLIYEANLLGIKIDLSEAKKMIGSSLKVDKNDEKALVEIAKGHGAKQDFLFPGVTPSSEETESLTELAYMAIKGNPVTTVRTLTGVGGLRYDTDWNHVTDLVTFVHLKVTEDKRYYPGMGIFYLLAKYTVDDLPVIKSLNRSLPEVYRRLQKFGKNLKKVEKYDCSGVSMLCSSYLPHWLEFAEAQGYLADYSLDLAEAFHSPSYEFVILKSIFEKLRQGKADAETWSIPLLTLAEKLDYGWTFNSTIHLPWTSELAGLSNDLMGKITNNLGDYCTRYGVGFGGKSLEVREYQFGLERKFPYGLGGKWAYQLIYYPQSDVFSGSSKKLFLSRSSFFVTEINRLGFIRAALNHLEEETHD